jgi:hypothetical protein
MWFLGAGASAAAGICTAYHMIWEFKRRIYCSSRRVPLSACADLSDPAVRCTIQRLCQSLPDAPPEDSAEEYTYYFEAAFPSEADRRRFIDQSVSGAAPSFGHLALAGLMKAGKVTAVWTTNFDRMVEDAAGRVFGTTGRLVVASIDSSKVAHEAMNESRWPLLAKVHGDFQSRRLKNTEEELRSQDAVLQNTLLQACQRFGLAVVGYSGRDASVMESLERALADRNGYPAGLFWFHRPESPLLPRVQTLLDRAKAAGTEAHVIEVETFDELFGDILSLLPDASPDILHLLDSRPTRVSNSPVPASHGSWPVIRFNAFPITSAPTMCRRVVCDIGGYREMWEAISRADVQVAAGRRSFGIIAFGDDADLQKAFGPYHISEFSLHAIDQARLRYESAELGLLYDALCRAIGRCCPVKVGGRRRATIIVDPDRLTDSRYTVLRSAVNPLCGKIPGTDVSWAESIRVGLELRSEKLLLLAEPAIWVPRTKDANPDPRIPVFIREKLARRYNPIWSKLLDGWAELLVGQEKAGTLRAFGITSGVDAAFEIQKTTAFSWRGGVR